MFADGVVLRPREKGVLDVKLEQWSREALEKRGMNVTRAKKQSVFNYYDWMERH